LPYLFRRKPEPLTCVGGSTWFSLTSSGTARKGMVVFLGFMTFMPEADSADAPLSNPVLGLNEAETNGYLCRSSLSERFLLLEDLPRGPRRQGTPCPPGSCPVGAPCPLHPVRAKAPRNPSGRGNNIPDLSVDFREKKAAPDLASEAGSVTASESVSLSAANGPARGRAGRPGRGQPPARPSLSHEGRDRSGDCYVPSDGSLCEATTTAQDHYAVFPPRVPPLRVFSGGWLVLRPLLPRPPSSRFLLAFSIRSRRSLGLREFLHDDRLPSTSPCVQQIEKAVVEQDHAVLAAGLDRGIAPVKSVF